MKKIIYICNLLMILFVIAGCNINTRIGSPMEYSSISGQVTDEEGTPVSGAEVEVDHKTTYTDSNGTYSFEEISGGLFSVTATRDSIDKDSKIGFNYYDTEQVSIDPEGNSYVVNLQIEPEVVVSNITITGEGSGSKRVSGQVTNYTANTINNIDITVTLLNRKGEEIQGETQTYPPIDISPGASKDWFVIFLYLGTVYDYTIDVSY